MQSVLFLCHRLPWPPSKGDKIRAYHVLRRLAEHYRVYLGTFVDDPDDWRHVAAVEAICADVCVRPLPRWRVRARMLAALARNEALTLGCYRDRVLQRWVERMLAAHKVDAVLCYSSGVAPLVLRDDTLPRVMDFVDADSDKWRQYAAARRGVAHVLYAREARKLAAFEHRVACRFSASVFVSAAEAAFFSARAPDIAGKVRGIPNGVDCDYWDPARTYANPFRSGERAIVFTGAMDYRANVDAVQWFADAVWPRVRAQRADAAFYIVGSNPDAAVLALATRPGIVVTGRVDDVRPYLAHAHAAVAPLRIARGIQNKVLEALAMEKAVLATPTAWEGIDDFAGRAGCISAAPDALATEAVHALAPLEPQRVPAARAYVQARYNWDRNLDAYETVLREASRTPAPVPAMTHAPLRQACP